MTYPPLMARNFSALPHDLDDLLPEPLPDEPFTLFKAWFDSAIEAMDQPNPNAMTLSTVDERGRPASRIVLCKDIDAVAGAVTFYTNYHSPKARQAESLGWVALAFLWDAQMRQVRIEGRVERTDPEDSDRYFASRMWIAKVGAWASDQSRPIESRAAMIARFDEAMKRFNLDPANPPPFDAEVPVPRPPHWGGYRVIAERVELWISGPGRVHDRAEWIREGPGWRSTRLQP